MVEMVSGLVDSKINFSPTKNINISQDKVNSESFINIFDLNGTENIKQAEKSMPSIVQDVLFSLRSSYLTQQTKLSISVENLNTSDPAAMFKMQMALIDVTALMKVQYGGATKISEAFSTLIKS